jgi:hypothetical protein
MKKLLLIVSAFFLALAINAQGTQTEDEVYVGKVKTFGKYSGTGIIIPDVGKTKKQPANPTTLTGIVINDGSNIQDSINGKPGGLYSFKLKKDDGTVVTVGTRDNDFTVPKKIIGRTITVEAVIIDRRRREINPGKPYQPDIQYAATGIKVID